MSEFIMLYRRPGNESCETAGASAEAQENKRKHVAWFKELEAKGQLKSLGQPLDNAGKVVWGKKKTITDGPYAETKDVVGGFSLIEAKDLDEAAQIASGCPIVERGGLVEVRPVRKLEL